jgi:hypothetical protein
MPGLRAELAVFFSNFLLIKELFALLLDLAWTWVISARMRKLETASN